MGAGHRHNTRHKCRIAPNNCRIVADKCRIAPDKCRIAEGTAPALADRVAEPPVDIQQRKVGGCPAGRPAIAVGDACLMAHQPGE